MARNIHRTQEKGDLSAASKLRTHCHGNAREEVLSAGLPAYSVVDQVQEMIPADDELHTFEVSV